MINSNLKYWKPRYLSFNYEPDNGGYRVGENIDDADVEMSLRELRIDSPVWYKNIEPCIYAYMEMCSNLVMRYNDRILQAKTMFTNLEAEAEQLQKSRHEPGTPEYYRLNDIGRKCRSLPELINHLESSRNVAIAIRDEARDMAKELLKQENT